MRVDAHYRKIAAQHKLWFWFSNAALIFLLAVNYELLKFDAWYEPAIVLCVTAFALIFVIVVPLAFIAATVINGLGFFTDGIGYINDPVHPVSSDFNLFFVVWWAMMGYVMFAFFGWWMKITDPDFIEARAIKRRTE